MFKRLITILFALCIFGTFSAAAQAETTGPVWKILSVDTPTNFKPGDQSGADAIIVTAVNVGGASTGCTAEQIAVETETKAPRPAFSPFKLCATNSPVVSPVTIADSLPAGLKAIEVFGVNTYHEPFGELSGVGSSGSTAEQNGPPDGPGLACTLSATPSCTTSELIDPGDTLVVTIRVDVESHVEGSGEVNEASVSGGGAVSASVSDPVTISIASPEYGVAQGGSLAATSTSQAGGHANFTSEVFLNTISPDGKAEDEHCTGGNGTPLPAAFCALESEPAASPKDISVDLPRGLVGTTVGVARCTMAEVVNEAHCPRNTMIGTATLIVQSVIGRLVLTVAVYNIAPAPGEPLALAFNAIFFPVRLDTSVLSDGEYNARVTAPDITGGAKVYMASVTVWGDPAEHDGPGPDAGVKTTAGRFFLREHFSPQISFNGPGIEEYNGGGSGIIKTVYQQRVPFLTNPSQCSTPLTGAVETDSWEAPGNFAGPRTAAAPMGTATGCGQLSFKPSVSMLPDTLEAGAPAGYSFKLTLPQNTEAEGLATPDVKKTTVTFPAGTVISPSVADGLGVCTSEQFYGPADERGQARPATPGSCPRDSQIGTVRVKTPALEEQLTGQVYLGAPECTGAGGVCTPADAADGRMIRVFVQFSSEGEGGIVVKLEGTGQINQQTGQITATFNETPQLPFSEFQLTLQGGERAAFANPRTCGEVHTTADLTAWSTPFTPDATPESKFYISENCFGAQFNPSFSFGTTSNQAGGYSPFSVSFGRGDDDGFLNGIQVRTPPGLLGMLSHVKLCEEPQANAGTCGPESQIGETTVETGPGADPFLVKGGKVFITGPYKGAPYGLSILVPAKAGPYTLSGTTGQGTVVNRSAISVNPETSALTITSDPLPTELDGIPLQLRLVNVTINRPEFMFNSTSCNKMAIDGTLTDTQAASAVESSSYQVTNCQALKFQPKFTVSTSGKTSRAAGASLDAKVTFPNTGQGTQADIHSFKVDLPKQLPSRLTTLQKACTAAVFEANPANCPAPSVIGTVRVNTPVLPVQLTGPVYFVSHGGEAFPSLEIVLQGDGVRVDVVAATFISKAGITSSTFKTVPDVPFESFELYLPEGPYSALTAIGNLCTSSLAMPTAIVAQNGAEIHESTKIGVTGCPKEKQAVKKKKKAKKASKARKSTNGRRAQS